MRRHKRHQKPSPFNLHPPQISTHLLSLSLCNEDQEEATGLPAAGRLRSDHLHGAADAAAAECGEEPGVAGGGGRRRGSSRGGEAAAPCRRGSRAQVRGGQAPRIAAGASSSSPFLQLPVRSRARRGGHCRSSSTECPSCSSVPLDRLRRTTPLWWRIAEGALVQSMVVLMMVATGGTD